MSKKNDGVRNKSVLMDEIESLNVDDLDVEELERRIELASAMPIIADGWLCGADCSALCGANCTSNGTCVANGCVSNGGCAANGGGGGGCIGPDGSSLIDSPQCL